MKPARLGVLVLAVAVILAATIAARRVIAPTRWEYLTVWDEKDTAALNALGRDGWELVAVSTASIQGTTAREVGWLFFKRPVTP